jgi:hypothetical protein
MSGNSSAGPKPAAVRRKRDGSRVFEIRIGACDKILEGDAPKLSILPAVRSYNILQMICFFLMKITGRGRQ